MVGIFVKDVNNDVGEFCHGQLQHHELGAVTLSQHQARVEL